MNQNSGGFLSSIPTVTKNLIIINVLCFFAAYVLSAKGIDLNSLCGLYYVQSPDFHPYQIITYMFFHGGLSHIFFNMYALFLFGRTLEMALGSKRFLFYYMFTGIGAGLTQLLIIAIRIHYLKANLSPDMVSAIYADGMSLIEQGKNYANASAGALNALINVPVIGASGAVFGILLAFGMLFPNAEFFIIPIPVPIKAKYLVMGYGALELFLGVANFSGDNIAHFAHLGGLFFGILLIFYWRKKDNLSGRFH